MMQYKHFGCKVNKYYLNQRLNYLPKQKNTIIIASCEVTDRAKKKYIKEIIHHAKKGEKILLTGCWSILQREKIDEKTLYDRYPELKERQTSITLLAESPPQQNNTDTKQNNKIKNTNIVTRKPIIIQTWCDNFCTFCLTVRKRGKHISRPAEDIINEIQQFQQSWWKEIVLTGINLAAWWCKNSTNPQESKFTELLKQIIDQTEIPRIRISSLWPEYINDDFFQIIQNPRFMPHFHLSIQSFSDSVLQNMKRNYDSQLLDHIIQQFHKHPSQDKLSLWADIISGFPWESDEDFQITYDAISKYRINKLHAFPFSPHLKGETVPASFLDAQIDHSIRKKRNQKLIAQGKHIRQEFIGLQKGKKFQVLLEQKKKWFRYGRTENYIEIKIDANSWNYQHNQLIPHILTQA